MIVDELVTLLGLKLDPKSLREAGLLKGAITGITTAAVLAGTALAAAAAAVQAYAFAQAQNVAESKRFADSLDINFEKLQALEYAAKASGGSAAELRADLEKLTKSMSSPIPGEYNQTLYMLGISSRDAAGKMKSADDLLLDIATKLQGMSKQRQMQFADRLGLSQTSLRLIQQGRKGIAELTSEAYALGVVLDKETGDRALKFQRRLQKLRASVDAVGTAVMSALLPALESAGDALGRWLGQNRELIAQGVQQVIEGVGRGFGMVGDALSWMWAQVLKLTGPFGELTGHFDAMQVIALAVAAAITAAGIAAAVAAAPYLAMAAAVAAVVLAVDELYTYLNGGDSVIGEWVDSFKQAYPMLSKYLGGLADLAGTLAKVFGSALVDNLKVLWGVAKATLGGIVGLLDLMVSVTDKVVGFFTSLGGSSTAAAPVSSTLPASVMASVMRPGGSGGAGATVIVNGAGDPAAVGYEVAGRLGLGGEVQSVVPGMTGPVGAY